MIEIGQTITCKANELEGYVHALHMVGYSVSIQEKDRKTYLVTINGLLRDGGGPDDD